MVKRTTRASQFDKKVVAFYSYKGGVGRTMALCHVALQLIRSHTSQRRESPRVLCIDLDLEAPGIPAYLPPPTAKTYLGFLGLLRDCGAGDGNMLGELRRAFADGGHGGAPYTYEVQPERGLHVLPVGDVDGAGRDRALDLLHRWLNKPIGTKPARPQLDFFHSLKTVLCDQYDYVLIDSRTGLADIAYATTAALADLMVLLFRPSSHQLNGVGRVLGRFLHEQKLTNRSQHIPVLPVMSPRPPYAAPELHAIRRAAKESVFQWLAAPAMDQRAAIRQSRASGPDPQLFELPYDSSLEVGDGLLLPLTSTDEPIDPEAPLFRAYCALSATVQQWNAAHDPVGLQHLEEVALANGDVDGAMEYMLMRLEAEPANEACWRDFRAHYARHLTADTRLEGRFFQFCSDLSADSSQPAIGRCYAYLWMSEVREHSAPDTVASNVVHMWNMCLKLGASAVLDDALGRIVRFHRAHHGGPDLRLPARVAAAEAKLLVELSRPSVSRAALRPWAYHLQEAYASAVRHEESRMSTLYALLGMLDTAHQRSSVYMTIAQGATRALRFDQACAAATAVLQTDRKSASRRLEATYYLSRFLSDEVSNRYADELPVYMRDRVRVIMALRARRHPEDVRRLLARWSEFDQQSARQPTFEAWSQLMHEQFAEVGETVLKAVRDGVTLTLPDMVLAALAEWCAKETPIEGAVRTQLVAGRHYQRDGSAMAFLLTDVAALAIDPARIGDLAAAKAVESTWLLDRTIYSILAVTREDGEKYIAPSVDFLRLSPQTARFLRQDQVWPLLRIVWNRLCLFAGFSKTRQAVFNQMLNTIETFPCPISNASTWEKELTRLTVEPTFGTEQIIAWRAKLHGSVIDADLRRIVRLISSSQTEVDIPPLDMSDDVFSSNGNETSY
jgi:cellulose biosynthesis protein BcsQ